MMTKMNPLIFSILLSVVLMIAIIGIVYTINMGANLKFVKACKDLGYNSLTDYVAVYGYFECDYNYRFAIVHDKQCIKSNKWDYTCEEWGTSERVEKLS